MVNMGSDWWNQNGGTYVVCQYYGPGNYMGETMYDFGAVGSECENGMDETYDGLCATEGNDICDLPNAPEADRCGDTGTCSAAGAEIQGFASEFTCECGDMFYGKWCENAHCDDVLSLDGQRPTGWIGAYFLEGTEPSATKMGGSYFLFQSYDFSSAMNWCTLHANDEFGCKAVV